MVRNDIQRLLVEYGIGTLVSSAACGADIVALEVAAELGLRLVIVLPFERDEFRVTSVTDRGEGWGARFDALLDAPNLPRELIVLTRTSGSDDEAYAEATKRLLTEASQRAPKGTSPLAIVAWEGRARAGTDATRDFLDRATAAGMITRVVISNPEQAAHRYLVGSECQADHALDVRQALLQSDPVTAYELTREVARRFLRTPQATSPQTVRRLWKACKQVEAFGLARRILRLRIEELRSGCTPMSATELGELIQQRALCTSKDPDLSAAMRHDWALEILKPDDHPRDSEHQGIAGGIFKRRWEWDGSRASLERSLHHYRAGIPDQLPPLQDRIFSECGYVEINCAFVLDLLASLVQDRETTERYRAEASEHRRALTALKPRDRWSYATLAEAYLGLERFAEAQQAIARYIAHGPDPWELETTLRQLVRLAHLRHLPEEKVRTVLAATFTKGSESGAAGSVALTSLLLGKVGLALSGGGFRASLFHLGVLARLAEHGVLRHVEVLSCVSGGSIVGALYYQYLKRALEERGEALNDEHYVELVRQLIGHFVNGVSRNVRTGLLTNFRNSLAIVSGEDRRFGQAVASAFHQWFYAKLEPAAKYMDELDIRPKEGPPHFHPGRHNWTRRNKVPTLVLNAATLNTGHSWQFTARSMGESPFTLQPAVDSNARLRRANYSALRARRVEMSAAVAASASVPGLFAPLQLDDLYEGYGVRLVDGGVFDNQGTSSLLEQDCQVLLVSDAAGQLFAEVTARCGHVSPLLRSISIFQERIRQSSYDALTKRKEAGQVRSVIYTHLTQGLGVPAVDWKDCEDPLQEGDQLPGPVRDGRTTAINADLQMCLAKMRTDLDIFSEIECAALMASGYLSMAQPLEPLLARLKPAGDAEAPGGHTDSSPRFWFSELLPLMRSADRNSAAYRLLYQHLDAGALGVGRLMRLDKGFKYVAYGVFGVLVLALGCAIYIYRHAPLWTLGAAVWFALVLALRQFAGKIGIWVSNFIDVVTDPVGRIRTPVYRYLAALALTGVALLVVKCLDPRYLRRGALSKLLDAK
jgi:predicted acylesterase/phospholipase RssA